MHLSTCNMLLILTVLYKCELLVLKPAWGVALLPLAVAVMNIKGVRKFRTHLYRPSQPGGGFLKGTSTAAALHVTPSASVFKVPDKNVSIFVTKKRLLVSKFTQNWDWSCSSVQFLWLQLTQMSDDFCPLQDTSCFLYNGRGKWNRSGSDPSWTCIKPEQLKVNKFAPCWELFKWDTNLDQYV